MPDEKINFLVFIGRAGCLPNSTHDFESFEDVCNFLDELEGREEEFHRDAGISDWGDVYPSPTSGEVRIGHFRDTREVVSVKYVS